MVELVLELFLELFLEVVVSIGWEGAATLAGRRPHMHPALAALAYATLGAAVGATSAFLWPERTLSDGPAVAFVVLNTVIAGAALHAFGRLRHRREKPSTQLASFFGGAALAFGLSATRLALLWG